MINRVLMFRFNQKLIIIVAAIMLAACDKSSTDNGEPASNTRSADASASSASVNEGFSLIKKPFDYQSMLINYADNIIIPTYKNFDLALAELNQELGAHCETLSAAPSNIEFEIGLAQTQQAWKKAMGIWQQAEFLWVGPLASNNNSLRNRIYSFATTEKADACAIDIATIEHNLQPLILSSRNNTVRGLDALEYMLFESSLNTACSQAINQTASWNGLPESTRQLQRCNFAIAIVEDLQSHSAQLNNAWANEGDNYRSLFINPNNAGPHLKALSDALFYLDKEVTDSKLGIPLAQTDQCLLEACPQAIETRYANNNGEIILHNLKAFKMLFNGNSTTKDPGIGFDDIIIFEDFAKISLQINTKIDAAIAMAEQLTEPGLLVEQATLQQVNQAKAQCAAQSIDAQNGNIQTASFCALHGLIQAVNRHMRTDFVTIVNVDLPVRAQSDND